MQHPSATANIMGTMYAPTNGGFFLPQGIQNQRATQFMPMPTTVANIPNAQSRNMTSRWNNNTMGGYSKGIFNPIL
jgi:hypothetical protein